MAIKQILNKIAITLGLRKHMTVEQDAGNLLQFFYDELYNKHKRTVDTKDVVDNIKWSDRRRIDTAFNYLKDNGWLIIGQTGAGNFEGVQIFRVTGLSRQGIEQVEDKKKFKATFGFEANVGILKLSLSKEI